MGAFELNPITRGAMFTGNILATISTGLTTASDVITGETNITTSLSVSSNGAQYSSSVSTGRDSLTSGALTGAGWVSPIGLTSAPLAAAAFANDTGYLYVGPFSKVPKSFNISTGFEVRWNDHCME